MLNFQEGPSMSKLRTTQLEEQNETEKTIGRNCTTHTVTNIHRHMQDEKSVEENETHSEYLSRFTILEIGNINNPS